MAGRRRIGIKKRELEDGDNLAILWCASSWTWREIENDRVDDEKLLVARSNKVCE